ncbi:hypothetical protein OG21DRAFT_1211076 [Imleria badia]|nr:hypothetical protein OG21DRAFT_1211076 [Imleria badia]
MSLKNTTDVHNPPSESSAGAPSATHGPQKREESGPPAKMRKVESDPQAKEDTATPALSPAQSTDNSHSEPEEPKPISSPCTCRCNGCCCHGTSSEPQHCVRCHTDYKLNHLEACMVPHVLYSADLELDDVPPRDLDARSVCCGASVRCGEPIKGDWQQPFPCFIGWHTTDVDAVEGQYNGINVLRCDPGPGGRCLRKQMKHHAHYENLFDADVKYIQIDKEDHEGYLKRKREEINDDRTFEDMFCYTEEGDDRN